jgi:uncharacterized protein
VPDRVTRCDLSTGSAPKVVHLASGAVRVDAAVTRVGVLEYSDGERTWGELKLPEEVFAPASMASLPGVAATIDHPPELVTPDTWDAVAVGHACDDVRPERDAGLLAVSTVLSSADAIAGAASGKLVEVSAGYTCELEEAEGTFEGKPYSAIQRRIVYNHVALGPRGWGRAGGDVKLRLNGGAVEVRPPRPHTTKEAHVAEKTVKKDGEMPPAEKEPAMDAGAMRLQAMEAALADALKANAQLKADMEAMKAAPPPAVTEENVPPAVQDSIAAKRVALVEGVRAVCGTEVKTDGRSALELHQEVVKKAFPSVKLDGLSADHVAGMATAAMSAAKTSHRSDALRDAHPGPASNDTRTDANDVDLDPAERLRRRTSRAWQTTSQKDA